MTWSPITDREIAAAAVHFRADKAARIARGESDPGPGGPGPESFARRWEGARERQAYAQDARERAGFARLPPLGPAPELPRKGCHYRNPPPPKRPKLLHRPPLDASPGWEPRTHSTPPPVRRALYGLRDALRGIGRPTAKDATGRDLSRISACGYAVRPGASAEGVGIVANPEGRCRYDGIIRCGSVHECPVCGAAIRNRRADELRELVHRHGADRTVLLTLTIRHGLGDDFARMLRGLSAAWRGFCRGEPWKRYRSRMGIVGTVRALETTHGPNGWHPHLHVLVLLDRAPDPRDVLRCAPCGHGEREACARGGCGEWCPSMDREAMRADARGWAIDRWQTMVDRHIGPEFIPDDEHGLSLRPSHVADYVAKLGLEVTNPHAKQGRREGHRTPLQIAADWKKSRRPRDAELWKAYCNAIVGRRQLTWSIGLRERYDLRERPDHDLADDEAPTNDDQLVATVPAPAWGIVRCTRMFGDPASVWLLEQIEQRGSVATDDALRAIETQHARQKAARYQRRNP